MAIATTRRFNPDVGDIIEEAFELCGIESRTGNDIRTARRSLNLLTLEWSNEGINLWTVESVDIPSSTIVAGTAGYAVDIDTIDIIEAVIRTDAGDANLQTDYFIEPISRPTYAQIPNKLQSGRPVQYAYHKAGIRDVTGVDQTGAVVFWPVPDLSNKYTFVYWRMKRMADAGTDASNTMEVPDRFIPALIYGLAAKIAYKKAQDKFPVLEAKAIQLFATAADADRIKTTSRFVPDMDVYR